ncbi:MAG: hypothetical protein JOZ60_01010 [Verrucomicrobia bacterium]|nr:hypothetical protein [Verrucomicrobiota bacterium]
MTGRPRNVTALRQKLPERVAAGKESEKRKQELQDNPIVLLLAIVLD